MPTCVVEGILTIIISVFIDYLDNGNNKMAIQQADKLLKKHKDLHCAKASSFALDLLIFGGLYIVVFKGEKCLISSVTMYVFFRVLS